MTVLNLHVEKITDGSRKERLKSFHRTASHAVRGSNPVLCHKRPFVLVHKFEKGSSRKHNISSHCQDHSGYASSVEGIPAGRNFPPFLNDQLRLQQLRQELVWMFKRCTLIDAQQIHDFLATVSRGWISWVRGAGYPLDPAEGWCKGLKAVEQPHQLPHHHARTMTFDQGIPSSIVVDPPDRSAIFESICIRPTQSHHRIKFDLANQLIAN